MPISYGFDVGESESVPIAPTVSTPGQKHLKVLTAGNMREAVSQGVTCGQCKWFDKDARASLAVSNMFTGLQYDDRWNPDWHDPRQFGYCRGASSRTAVAETVQACGGFESVGRLVSFMGQRHKERR